MLVGASCDEVKPAAPAVTQATCAGGAVCGPALALARTDGITYTIDPPARTDGQTAT